MNLQTPDFTTPIGTSMLLVIGLAASLVMVAGAIFREKLNFIKVALSCLASAAGATMVSLLAAQHVFTWASNFAGTSGSIESKWAFGGLAVTGVNMLIWLTVLALCLYFIAEVKKQMSVAMSLFSTGGTIVLASVFILERYSNMPSDARLPIFIAIGVGMALTLMGVFTGIYAPRSESNHRTDGWMHRNGDATDEDQAGRDTEYLNGTLNQSAGRPTALAGEKDRVIATAWLSIINGPNSGRRIDLNQPEFKIGRGTSCSVQVSGDDLMSREHALLRYEKGRHIIHDLTAKGTTFLNDNRVSEPRLLMKGDRIRLGQTLFEYVQAGR
jgi:Inner membrane component of T3SS, cytoplasmic domain